VPAGRYINTYYITLIDDMKLTVPALLLQITFFWAYNDVSQATVGAWLDVDTKRTLPDWFNMHRDLCIDWMRAHPKQRSRSRGTD